MVGENGENKMEVGIEAMEVGIRGLRHNISIRIKINDNEGKGRKGIIKRGL